VLHQHQSAGDDDNDDDDVKDMPYSPDGYAASSAAR
jgi:hypothetical protein